MIDRKYVSDDSNYHKIIDLFAGKTFGRLSLEELLPRLLRQGTLTRDDADEIRAEEQNHGGRRACWLLLFHLPNRVEDWFRNFMEALLDYDYNDIAEILDPDMFVGKLTIAYFSKDLRLNQQDVILCKVLLVVYPVCL